MKGDPRSVNTKRFLEVVPMPRPPTYWAIHPENVPSRIRRAANYYAEIAKVATSSGAATAPMWNALALIVDKAATEAEALDTAPVPTGKSA